MGWHTHEWKDRWHTHDEQGRMIIEQTCTGCNTTRQTERFHLPPPPSKFAEPDRVQKGGKAP